MPERQKGTWESVSVIGIEKMELLDKPHVATNKVYHQVL